MEDGDATPRTGMTALVALARRWPAQLFAMALVFFLVVGSRTPGDVDEGYFAVAAALTRHGHVPYRDFFFPQMPVVPYVFAALYAVTGPSYLAGRMLGAVFAALTAWLVGFAVHRETRHRVASGVAVLLFCVHTLSWQWLPLVKPYGFVGLLVTGGVVLVTPPRRAPSWVACAVAGIAVGLAMGARLLLAPMVGAVALGAAFSHAREPDEPAVRPWLRGVTVIMVATATVALIVVPLFRAAPYAFVFGNVRYHALRTSSGPIGHLTDGLALLGQMIGAGATEDRSSAGMQFAILIALNAMAVVLPGTRLRIAAWVGAALLAIAAILPNPAHEQYFTPLVPLLAIGAGCSLGRGLNAASLVPRRVAYALPLALVGIFTLAAVSGFVRRWGEGLYPWPMGEFRPMALDASVTYVARLHALHPGGVLPVWEGSALRCADGILSGYENQFVRNVSGALSAEMRQRIHAPTHDDFMLAIDARVPTLVVVDRGTDGDARLRLERVIADHRYTLAPGAMPHTRVWVRDEP